MRSVLRSVKGMQVLFPLNELIAPGTLATASAMRQLRTFLSFHQLPGSGRSIWVRLYVRLIRGGPRAQIVGLPGSGRSLLFAREVRS